MFATINIHEMSRVQSVKRWFSDSSSSSSSSSDEDEYNLPTRMRPTDLLSVAVEKRNELNKSKQGKLEQIVQQNMLIRKICNHMTEVRKARMGRKQRKRTWSSQCHEPANSTSTTPMPTPPKVYNTAEESKDKPTGYWKKTRQ